jgi:hypothetical protein
MTIKLKVMTGEVVDFVVSHEAEIGLENNGLTAPGSGPDEVTVYTGTVEGEVRTLLVQESYAYLLHKAPYDVDIVSIDKA